MALYSAGKAARDMYHACLAQEEEEQNRCSGSNRSTFRVLNYAPGPLETDMAEELRANERLDATLQPNFEHDLVDPMDSARALARLVLQEEKSTEQPCFVSGSHVDYFDLVKTEGQ